MPQPVTRSRAWLISSTVALVAVIAAITVVITLTGGGPKRPRDPKAVTQAWADAQLRHQTVVAESLQCRKELTTALDSLRLPASSVTGYAAGDATREDTDRWSVPLQAHSAGASQTVTIQVIRRKADYLVC